MPLSKIEQNYYLSRKKRAQGFIDRRKQKYVEEVALWLKEIAECDAKLSGHSLEEVEAAESNLHKPMVGNVDDLEEREVPPFVRNKNHG